MSPEDILELLERRPFVPFRIHMSDGSSYKVRHPEMAVVMRSTLFLGIAEYPDDRIADRFKFCSLMHINRVESIDGAASTSR